jgi:hypothetical protein
MPTSFRLVGTGNISDRPAANTVPSGGIWVDSYGRITYSNSVTWVDKLYDDWRWSGLGKGTGPSNPTRSVMNGGTTEVWEFTSGKTLHSDGNQIPHDYKEGTDIVPHLHWCPSTTGTYTGTWTMKYQEYLSVANGTALSAERTITAAFNASLTAFQMRSQDFSAVLAGAGRTISSIVHCSLTLTLSAGTSCFLNGWDGHYEKDALGSIAITGKDG